MPGKMVWKPARRKTKAGVPGHWDDRKRAEAASTFLATGSTALTSAITKVPEATIFEWRRKDWWQELITRIKDDEQLELDAKLKKIVSKALLVVEDRLDNGDIHVNSKTGEVKRVPAKLRDITKVSSDLTTQRTVLAKQHRASDKEIEVVDRLANLAETFAKFALSQTKQKQEKVIEGEVIDVTQ